MPAPQASMMQNFAKLAFKAKGVKLPVDWSDPTGDPDAQHYDNAFKPGEKITVPPVGLFVASSLNKYHTDTAKGISDMFTEYLDGICAAICSAWGQWQSAAVLTGVIINAVTATGGQVVGPPLLPLILASAPMDTAQKAKYSKAIATVINTAWQSYTASIKVPGMPWYPAFAAFPGPVAPPMPNVPGPLMALVQVPASVTMNALKSQLISNLGESDALHHKELFESIADAFDKCFQIWQKATMVTNVLGTGPIPTFAPPYVPVGPVVGGVGNMTPGGFV